MRKSGILIIFQFDRALHLSSRDDLYHDYAKGFIKVSGLPDVVPLTAQGLVITARTVSFLSFGHELVGQRVTRRGIDETSKTEDIPEGHAWEMDGKISGWLPPRFVVVGFWFAKSCRSFLLLVHDILREE